MEITHATNIALNLLVQHGLYNEGWVARLGKGQNRLGVCQYKTKIIRISRHHIQNATDAEIIDTIRHEVAHAIAAKQGDRLHGPIWQSVALKLGANPRPTAKVSYQIAQRTRKYLLTCTVCNRVMQRRANRVSAQRLQRLFHRQCGHISIGKLQVSLAPQV
jgi:predicted SprT family Zn-dependent metalloprotease